MRYTVVILPVGKIVDVQYRPAVPIEEKMPD
jgi:hypothetical protein